MDLAGQAWRAAWPREAELLLGIAKSSGKLADTFAASLEDPLLAGLLRIGRLRGLRGRIYVGYRYFETIPGAAAEVNYPFGLGCHRIPRFQGRLRV